MPLTIPRPAASEYAPYFAPYVAKVPEGDILELLAHQIDETTTMLGGLNDQQAAFRYAPGKWSVKQVVGHLTEAERVFSYRALCFARGDATPLPGWDENAYVANAHYDRRSMSALVADLRAARASTISLFRGFDGEELERAGTANNKLYSVRSIAYITAGHEQHHVDIIRARYLAGAR